MSFSITIAEGSTTGTFFLTPGGATGNRDVSITTDPALTYPGSPVTYNATASGTAYTLDAAKGVYSESGSSATLAYSIVIPEGDTVGHFYLTPQATGGNRDVAITTSPTLSYPGSPITYDATTMVAYTLDAAKGTYAETGTDATLKAARGLVGAKGTYTETGTDATLKAARGLVGAKGTYTETGTDATLKAARGLVGAKGTYTETGLGSTLKSTRSLVGAKGSYSGTGADATLTHNVGAISYTLDAAVGSYAGTGADATLTHTFHVVIAEGSTTGTFFLTPGGATGNRDVSITTDPALTYPGSPVTYNATASGTYTLDGAAGSYGETGADATLTYVLNAPHITIAEGDTTGAFRVIPHATAGSRDISITPLGGPTSVGSPHAYNTFIAHTLDAAKGTYTETGLGSTLKSTRSLVGAKGSYAETGADATLTHNVGAISYTLDAVVGSYAGTGADATLKAARGLVGAKGTYTETGTDATLKAARGLVGAKGTYAETGNDATLKAARGLVGANGTYAETGLDATIIFGHPSAGVHTLDAAKGSYVESGLNASFKVARILVGAKGVYAEAGTDSTSVRGRYLAGAKGTYAEVGLNASFRSTRSLVAAMGVYAEIGQPAETDKASYAGVFPDPLGASLVVRYDPTSATVSPQVDPTSATVTYQQV